MSVVVDLGCYPHQDIDSIGILADRYQPRLLLGFDPLAQPELFRRGDTVVMTVPLAAWTRSGTVGFQEAGIDSSVSNMGGQTVGCFDLADLLAAFDGEQLVVKMDVEGAEYPLLEHLHAENADARLDLLIVEWHGDDDERDRLLPKMRCRIEEWCL